MDTTEIGIELPGTGNHKVRPCREGEEACVVCRRPVKMSSRTSMLWMHFGGAKAVTQAEGEALNAAGRQSSDVGLHPIGSDCLRQNPELKPYVIAR